MPGGHRAGDEDLEATLVRELREELGVTAREYRTVAVLGELQPSEHGEAEYHVFIVTAWDGGEPRLLGSEHSELRWFTRNEALALSLAHPEYRGLLRAALPGTGDPRAPWNPALHPTPPSRRG